MRQLYNLLIILALPFFLLRLKYRAKKSPAYASRIHERFGRVHFKPVKPVIWLHAVSLGESIAATSLIKKLLVLYPTHQIVVTNMTPTGSLHIKKNFAEQIFNCYVPFDVFFAVKNFLKTVKPKICIIMETELWPNLLYYTNQQKIPMMLANARLSEKSARAYGLIQPLAKLMLRKINCIAAQSAEDAKRFVVLGADSSQVKIFGNIKFDIEIPQDLVEKGQALREKFGAQRPVFIAASTHEGEEVQILQAFHLIKKKIPTALLVLVPRHPERFQAVYDLAITRGFRVIKRSQPVDDAAVADIFLGDSVGEMFMYYAICDVAFVGGSLVPIGGHNFLEPAALGLPLLSGKALHHFAHISDLLVKAKALHIVENQAALAAAVIDLFQQPGKISSQGEAARQVFLSHQGALNKILDMIGSLVL